MLQQAERCGDSWGSANHCGWPTFNALGYTRAINTWPEIVDTTVARWSRGAWMAPMPLFPSYALSTKVLCDRTTELWADSGLGTTQIFLRQYAFLPLLPTVGGMPRVLSILQRRSAILGSDLLPVRHPPHLLLHYIWSGA